ncbi:hypothetical protein A2454_04550 [Candidatus Peribacteria bacterium RIFOXYC2_FULL_55_14]|nr:MAG: Ribosomal protein S23 [Candidatus Peribacteria bacterium GW2011_GWB1_54_5]KKW44432.1 MAG: Ribosomal protein S23 [Candidatus Peregrinibacteria bacterium GW2011_GWA2_54_9]OGJ70981.1 MAG: hypothetical protein A2198_01075 [Candidatus Peribacteria bacterium RIFOXYA1_FULL_56_14]OGJ74275.1 MAG: hypothetical protein A2384_06110 [Candidatus Peribacteria bacterium RIFOXYB1_FULL_54_35]OGJ75190.1 MAG: hypothetical protein A2217_05690 [Candidatus Peribacteria bacterium RIFOXYA2_FULL_55_28]OGJ75893.
MDSFTDLQAWQKGLQMTKEIYKLSGKFPRSELFALTSQIRRASTSILANIAEGFGRYTYADKAYKYTIARGECSEVYAFLLIALELGFISRNDTETALNLNGEVGRILSGLISSCRSQS